MTGIEVFEVAFAAFTLGAASGLAIGALSGFFYKLFS